MTFDERLVIYETVIKALKTKSDMVSALSNLPLHQQVAGVRFMEFLERETALPKTEESWDLPQ